MFYTYGHILSVNVFIKILSVYKPIIINYVFYDFNKVPEDAIIWKSQ